MNKLLITLADVAAFASCTAWSQVVVRVGPPPVIVERPIPRSGPRYVWLAGYYRWDGARYIWAPGSNGATYTSQRTAEPGELNSTKTGVGPNGGVYTDQRSVSNGQVSNVWAVTPAPQP
jgi:hypothetical protein